MTTMITTRFCTAPLAVAAILMLATACATDDGGSGGDGSGDMDDDGSGGGGGGGGGAGGGGGGGDGATAFRVTDLDIRDPHIFIDAIGCQDVTESPLNESLQSSITDDAGSPADPQTPDGLLDFSALVVMHPVDPAAATTSLELLMGADCTAPMESTSCSPGAAAVATAEAANAPSAACDIILADTTTGSYTPAPPVAPAPCFASDSTDGELRLDPFVLSDYAIAASYDGDPASGLVSGVVRGFMSEADAEATTVDTPVGARTVASLLPGGDGSCASGDARDAGPDGEPGWYFYLAFTAEVVPYPE
jgi:hypothetical protein